MTGSADREQGLAAYGRRAWGEAHAALAAADAATPLDADDLERLASAAYLVGHEDESARAWERAFHARVAEGAPDRAAYCGFWIAFGMLSRGEPARAAGWLARSRRALGPDVPECAALGYLALPDAVARVQSGDATGALAVAADTIALGERCGDTDLVAFARCVQGRALIRAGRPVEGVALLDEVMVAVVGDEITPVLAGDLYCTVIEGCQEVYDVGRAHEWTEALTAWCAAQPDLVPYRGQCLVHRAEIMMLRGAWPDAADTARRAHARLSAPPGHPAAGAAAYVEGELYRLRGAYGEAEAAYRRASGWGREPQPGLALLRLAQGRRDTARAAIGRAVDEATGEANAAARPPLLAAAVEIALAGGDVAAARGAADRLAGIADALDAPILRAMAAEARGAVLAAEGEVSGALAALRGAWTAWHRLPAPYAAALCSRLAASRSRRCRAPSTWSQMPSPSGTFPGSGFASHAPAAGRGAGCAIRGTSGARPRGLPSPTRAEQQSDQQRNRAQPEGCEQRVAVDRAQSVRKP